MKVLVVGGGSGGHITPAVAVVREIIKQRPRTKVEFWTNRKYYDHVVKITTEIKGNHRAGKRVVVRKIFAGKFNRYAGWGCMDYIKNWGITIHDLIFRNVIGLCGFVGGLCQSFCRLLSKKKRPDVIFLKGGFVGLPVGIIAKILKIPYVIHESDATPGLANRMLMDQAKVIAIGFDGPFWDNRKDAPVINVGIPVAPEFRPINKSHQRELKRAFGFDPDKLLTVITGGSQGSENINNAICEVLSDALKNTNIGLVAGRKHYQEVLNFVKEHKEYQDATKQSSLKIWDFTPVMDELMGASDIVISRAGATTIAEIAALDKPVILVPFERLPGSHQAKNARMLETEQAVAVVSDEAMQQDATLLLNAIERLASSPEDRKKLATNLHKTARPDAAKHLAEIILQVAVGDIPTEVSR